MGSPRQAVLENEFVRVVILPELGGKIASLSIQRNGLELLQQPLHPYEKRTWAQDFGSSDASGWDECLPTVSACTVSVGQKIQQIPDHGDIWLLPAAHTANASEIILETALASMPLRLRRQITLDGSALRVRYELSNHAKISIPYLWSAHPLFAVDAADRILLPQQVQQVRVESSAEARLGKHNDLCVWPIAKDRHGHDVDLRIAQAPETAIADKLFAGPLQQGAAGIYRAQHKAGVVIHFATETIPYLGMWLCYGGWPGDSTQRQQAVALEPCMAPVDSLAEAMVTGCACALAAGATASWQMDFNIRGTEKDVSYEEFAGIFTSGTGFTS